MDAYTSGYDKARKPYVPIDTCSPAGTWIEEKRYNKGRPTQRSDNASGSRKVLCGNWQEEAALEGDLLKMEQTEQQQQQQQPSDREGSGRKDMQATLGASLDVIKEVGPGRFAGGYKSSPYLTADAADPTQRDLNSTHRTDYNAKNGDVKALARPDLGVRSQMMLQQALAAAEEEQARAKAATIEKQSQHAQSSLLRGSQRGGGGTMSAALADPATVYTESVYTRTVSNARAHESTSWDKPEIDELRQEYLSDEAITLYTGNPESGKTMTVHGKTPVDPVSSSRFGKHTHFSEPKYHL